MSLEQPRQELTFDGKDLRVFLIEIIYKAKATGREVYGKFPKYNVEVVAQANSNLADLEEAYWVQVRGRKEI